MKRFFYSLTLALLVATTALPSFATCTQGGGCRFGGCLSYDYAYNGSFSDMNCGWSYYGGAAQVTAGSMCNGFFSTYGELGPHYSHTAEIRQYVTIPSTETRTNWLLGYNVQFSDPHSSSSNSMTATLIDTTTNTVLASKTYFGSNGDPNCNQDILSAIPTNLAGHTVQIDFSSYILNSDTYARVTNVQLVAY